MHDDETGPAPSAAELLPHTVNLLRQFLDDLRGASPRRLMDWNCDVENPDIYSLSVSYHDPAEGISPEHLLEMEKITTVFLRPPCVIPHDETIGSLKIVIDKLLEKSGYPPAGEEWEDMAENTATSSGVFDAEDGFLVRSLKINCRTKTPEKLRAALDVSEDMLWSLCHEALEETFERKKHDKDYGVEHDYGDDDDGLDDDISAILTPKKPEPLPS